MGGFNGVGGRSALLAWVLGHGTCLGVSLGWVGLVCFSVK